MTQRKKNKFAVALGRRGGQANTPAQRAARAENGKLGGRPPLYRWRGATIERRSGDRWSEVRPPYSAAVKAWVRREAEWQYECQECEETNRLPHPPFPAVHTCRECGKIWDVQKLNAKGYLVLRWRTAKP